MSPLFKEIERHLEYQGYSVVFEEGVLKAEHGTKPKFWIHPSLNGALFITLYALGEGGLSDRSAVLEFLDKANGRSAVASFCSYQDYLQVKAWFPSAYSKSAFSEFLDQYLAEIDAPATNDRAAVKKLFWDKKPTRPPENAELE